MKKFLAVFTGSHDSANAAKWSALDPDKRRERERAGMKAWTEWAQKTAKITLDHGGPLSKTKRIDASGISDIRNQMSAYVVVEAESQEAAAKLFVNHPHFSIFPGDGVDVMECMPIPT